MRKRSSLALLALLLPLAILAILRANSHDTLAGVTFDAAPILAAPTPRDVTDETPVKVTPAWAKGDSLFAPAWSGIVTAISAQGGAVLHSGDAVATVAGVKRIAFASNAPFFRPIASGDSGADVAELHRLLQLTGSLTTAPADPQTATFATTVAIRALSTSLGVDPPASTFDPGWVVWLPSEPFALGELDLHTGQLAPGPGSAIATSAPVLTAAALSALNQQPITVDPAVAWVLAVGDKTFEVDPTKLAVATDALPALAVTLKPNADSATGTLRRRVVLHVLGVPSTAIQSSASGALCAWIADGKGYRAVAVTLAGARAGVTNVATGIAPTDQVLVNPSAALEHPTCP